MSYAQESVAKQRSARDLKTPQQWNAETSQATGEIPAGDRGRNRSGVTKVVGMAAGAPRAHWARPTRSSGRTAEPWTEAVGNALESMERDQAAGHGTNK